MLLVYLDISLSDIWESNDDRVQKIWHFEWHFSCLLACCCVGLLAKADSRFWDWVILWMWCCDSYLSVKYFKAPFCVKHVVRLWDSYVCTYLGIVSPYIPTSCYCEEVELPPGNRPLKSAHHISQLRVTISYKYIAGLVWIYSEKKNEKKQTEKNLKSQSYIN